MLLCIIYYIYYRIVNSVKWGLLFILLICIVGESVLELIELYYVLRNIRVNLFYSILGKIDICVYIFMLKVCEVLGYVLYIYKYYFVYYVKKYFDEWRRLFILILYFC